MGLPSVSLTVSGGLRASESNGWHQMLPAVRKRGDLAVSAAGAIEPGEQSGRVARLMPVVRWRSSV